MQENFRIAAVFLRSSDRTAVKTSHGPGRPDPRYSGLNDRNSCGVVSVSGPHVIPT
jgi:hypothetical protein